MVGIRNGHFERIAEDSCGLREAHAVFLEIRGGLVRIPFELHDQSLPSSLGSA